MGRSKSSQRWLDRQRRDPYVRQARSDGLRSRAAYKLREIDQKDRLLRPGSRVIDLGAAPGGWSQVAAAIVGLSGRIVALDCLAMEPIPGVTFVRGDFRQADTLAQVVDLFAGQPVDLVLSDMAPNVSGSQIVDQPRMIHLCELALELARDVLKPGGDLAIKIFQGEGFDAVLADLRGSFERVVCRKPEASRSQSREVYLVAKGFRVV